MACQVDLEHRRVDRARLGILLLLELRLMVLSRLLLMMLVLSWHLVDRRLAETLLKLTGHWRHELLSMWLHSSHCHLWLLLEV